MAEMGKVKVDIAPFTVQQARRYVVVREDDAGMSDPIMLRDVPLTGDILSLEIPERNLEGLFVVTGRRIGTEFDTRVIVVPAPTAADVIPPSGQLDPVPGSDEWQLRCSGETETGENVLAWVREGGPYGDWRVIINGEELKVARVERLRDGGTTVLNLREQDGGEHRLVFPRRIGIDDHTPRLNGRKVE